MGQAAADRASIPDLDVADLGHRVSQERTVLAHQSGGFHRPLTGHGPDGQVAVVDPDAVEPGDLVEVHQVCRPREPEVEERDEALPAGQHLRLLAVLAQYAERLLDR